MSAITPTFSPKRDTSLNFIAGTIKVWMQRKTYRNSLAVLSDHMLRDVGLDKHLRDRECSKFFWQK